MMNITSSVCLTCGSNGPLDQHHVATRAINPTFTIPVCKPCHKTLTAHQWVHRTIKLYDADPTGIVYAWAHVRGVVDVLELLLINRGEPSDASKGFGELCYRVIRTVGTIDTASIPTPKPVKLRKEQQARFREANLIDTMGGLAGMTAIVCEMTLGRDDNLTRLFVVVQRDPETFYLWCKEHNERLTAWAQSTVIRIFVSSVGGVLTVARTMREILDELDALAREYLEVE